mmetsp:Transcript_27799/g.64189  ORF Transcript_27799/g.64189 Transcript_27799/m.64189 type:complete len:84 (+) Transcript_27799:261-512(+)
MTCQTSTVRVIPISGAVTPVNNSSASCRLCNESSLSVLPTSGNTFKSRLGLCFARMSVYPHLHGMRCYFASCCLSCGPTCIDA